MFEVQQQLIPGSIVRFRSRRYSYVFFHYGMIDNFSLHTGEQMVTHSEKGSVVKMTTLSEFSEGEQLEIVWTPETQQEQVSMMHRMHSLMGHPYDLFRANCEQVVNWAKTGKAFSTQFQMVGLALGAGAILWAIARSGVSLEV